MEIIYENDDFLAINKPAGLKVHDDGIKEEKTLTSWILTNYPQLKDVGEPLKLSNGKTIFKPGIVHRLDKDTSGIIIIAKNQNSYLEFKKLFKERNIQKIYWAFVYDEILWETKIIEKNIGRSKGDFRKWTTIEKSIRGKKRDSKTSFELLKKNKTYSLIEAKPKTGRTHQIRVHLKSINHPIVADKLYGGKRYKKDKNNLGFNRLALHAKNIKFIFQKQKYNLKAKLPNDFQTALKQL